MKKYTKEELESLSIEELGKIVEELYYKMNYYYTRRSEIKEKFEKKNGIYIGMLITYTTMVIIRHLISREHISKNDLIIAGIIDTLAVLAVEVPSIVTEIKLNKTSIEYDKANEVLTKTKRENYKQDAIAKSYDKLNETLAQLNTVYELDYDCEHKRTSIWTNDLLRSGLDETIVYSETVQQVLRSFLNENGYSYRLRVKSFPDFNEYELEFYLRQDCGGSASYHYMMGKCSEGKTDEYAFIKYPNDVIVYMDNQGKITKATKNVVICYPLENIQISVTNDEFVRTRKKG